MTDEAHDESSVMAHNKILEKSEEDGSSMMMRDEN